MNRRFKYKIDFICIIMGALLMVLQNANAQSDHYWSQNFNTESSLTAGTVIGGEAGASAVFYNPSLINENDEKKLSFSTNLISGQYTKLKNIAGEETQTDRFNLLLRPKFASYIGRLKGNNRIAYELAVLTPLSRNYRIDYFYNDQKDILKRLDGKEDLNGKILLKDKYQDLFIGGGMSYMLNDKFSVGLSSFVSVKTLDYSSDLSIQVSPVDDLINAGGTPISYYSAVNSYYEWIKYWDVSMRFKLGAHYISESKRLGIGMNISLPSLHIYGEGKVEKEFKRANIYEQSSNSYIENLDFQAYQNHVMTYVKDPFSISLGLQYKTKSLKNGIMFSMEYFAPIEEYRILNTKDYYANGNVDVEDLALAMTYLSAAKQIFNFGFGYTQYFNDKLTLSGGFKTDFNSLATINRTGEHTEYLSSELRNIYVDKYHFIVGPNFEVKSFGVVLGIQYTWGRQKNLQNFANLSDAVEYIPESNLALQGPEQNNMTIYFNEVSLFFGLTYGFGY